MRAEDYALVHNFGPSLLAIDLLHERQLTGPCLVQVYATVDAAASLTVEEEGDVTSDDFVAWVENYMLPGSGLTCTGLELYGARCGVLHALTPFSRLSRRGIVRTINYAWGKSKLEVLAAAIVRAERTDIVAVHLDDLCAAVRGGIRKFFDLVATDEPLRKIVHARADRLFVQLFSDSIPARS